jgi:predicted molibdopterin-dependent oxidoreductase YjgC
MEDKLLRRKDKNPNSRGCQDIGIAPGEGGRNIEAILAGVNSGDIKALVVLSVGHKMPEDIRSKLAAALGKVKVGILIDCMKTELVRNAQTTIAAVAYAETHGTYTNYAGRLQRIQPTMPLGGEARPGWEILRELLKAMKAEVNYPSAWAVTREMLDKTPAYSGLGIKEIGPQGALPPSAVKTQKGSGEKS